MSLKYTVVDAFTDKRFSGNPAAVIILPTEPCYDDVILQGIATEMNLSETAFVIQPPRVDKSDAEYQPSDEPYVSYGLRWFTTVEEWRGVCGHATICSASVLFADESRVPSGIHEIRFSTLSGLLIARRIVRDGAPTQYELEFPAGDIVQLSDLAADKVQEVVVKATHPDLKVEFMGVCSAKAPYNGYLLVEIDDKVPLKGLKVDSGILGTLGPQHVVTVMCQKTTDGSEDFDYRTFAMPAGLAEDPVCGSATSFATKYWASRAAVLRKGKEEKNATANDALEQTSSVTENVIKIRSVSSRGGSVDLVWDEGAKKAMIRGNARVASRGEIYV